MIKKIISVLLIGAILFQGVALADFNYSELKETLNGRDDFVLYENEEQKASFISREVFSIAERSFEHKGSSDGYYSYFVNDWLVLDYDHEAQPRRRLWIYYSTKEPQNVSSISFSFDGNTYTFSNFFHPDKDIAQYDNGEYCQSIVLIFGNKSRSFLDNMIAYVDSFSSYEDFLKMPPVKMVMHGKEEITIDLPDTFMMDCVRTDLLFPEPEKHKEILNMSLYPTTFEMVSDSELESSDVLILGENEEFAISTNGSYTYNTPTSDLSGYETTDKYLFENINNIVCIVHNYTNSAVISYYPTENNSTLSPKKMIARCIEYGFGEDAGIFNGTFTCKRDYAQIRISAIDDFGYYEHAFVILEHGIIGISCTSSDKTIDTFVSEIVDSLLAKDDNSFIY